MGSPSISLSYGVRREVLAQIAPDAMPDVA